MSTTASTMAVVISQQANRVACEALMREYQHERATVTEMRNYAECVKTVHPNDFSATEVLVLKGTFTIILLCILGMALFNARKRFGHEYHRDAWWEAYIALPLVAGIIAAFAMFVGGLLSWMVGFVVWG